MFVRHVADLVSEHTGEFRRRGVERHRPPGRGPAPLPPPATSPGSSTASYPRLSVDAGSHGGSPADHFEDRDRMRLPFHDDVAERPELILALQSLACGVANDNPSAELLVERLEPRAQIDRIANHRIAHDRLASDVPGDHRTGVDSDADVEPGKTACGLPSRVQTAELGNHRE